MIKSEFTNGELVWHTNFKCKVEYLLEMKQLKGRWFYVKLPNGGYMETQLITKYNGQDKKENRTNIM